MSQVKSRTFIPEQISSVLLLGTPSAILLVVIILSIISGVSQQFSDLAKAFLHGQLNFLHPIGGLGYDPIIYNGKIYWGEGPFPALLLMPFVGIFEVFHAFFYQGYLQWLFILGVMYFVYKLARGLEYIREDSLILMFGFILGSVFIGVASQSSSWLFAQVLTTFLLFWSLYEFYTKKRWWLIGIICALILITRVTAAPILIFYILELWQSIKDRSERIRQLTSLCGPFVLAAALLALYNYARFHNPFNGGFAYQLLEPDSAKSRAYGLFSLVHIPSNFYGAVLSAPLTVLKDNTSWTLKFPFIRSNPNGISIFITSPYFLYLFTQKWSYFNTQARHLIVAISISFFLVLCFYGIGKEQLGYRYTLDFLPELFMLFMMVYRLNHNRLTKGMITLLIGAGITNFYLLWTYI